MQEISYYELMIDEDQTELYRVVGNQTHYWMDGQWKESGFAIEDIHGISEKLDPSIYPHPAFVKERFYKEVLGEDS